MKNHSKRCCRIQLLTNHISRNRTSLLLDRIDLWILVRSKIFQITNEAHVPGHKLLQRIHPILGYARPLDEKDRVS